jgi:hypothetical protein
MCFMPSFTDQKRNVSKPPFKSLMASVPRGPVAPLTMYSLLVAVHLIFVNSSFSGAHTSPHYRSAPRITL